MFAIMELNGSRNLLDFLGLHCFCEVSINTSRDYTGNQTRIKDPFYLLGFLFFVRFHKGIYIKNTQEISLIRIRDLLHVLGFH